MLREALKILAYLSILTSTRTSSSYLDPQSLVSYRRAVANLDNLPSPLNNLQQQQISDDADIYEWHSSSSSSSNSNMDKPYFIPRLVNANNMLYAQQQQQQQLPQQQQQQQQQQQMISSNNKNLINNNNNNYNIRRQNKKSRKSKKQQQQQQESRSTSKQLYENHSKRRNNFDMMHEDEFVVASGSGLDNVQAPAPPSALSISNANSNNNTDAAVLRNYTTNNEYPTAQIDAKHERELQELFGIEGARKYQQYQLQQQLLSEQFGEKSIAPQTSAAAAATVDDVVVVDDDTAKETQKKRDGGGLGAGEEMQDVSGAMINQMMSRTTRRQREYDVPLIQCPPATDGMERFACPTPDRQGRYRCIDDHVLCDGFIDCPEGADEDRQACMFYKTTKAHLDVLADALLRWARGR